MPTGVIINAASVLFGGLLGGFLGDKFSEQFKNDITLIFGVCSMGMGIYSIAPMKYMPGCYFCISYRNRNWSLDAFRSMDQQRCHGNAKTNLQTFS